MAYSFNLNNTPANGAAAMFILKTLLKAQGWTVPRSSDGTTYNSTGDQITTNTTGAGGMLNAKAWFVIQAPTTGRQFCIQKDANATTGVGWRIKYSFSAGFTGGTPGATAVPSATDEGVLLGAGTDAAPTFNNLFGTDGTYRFNCASDAASPYGFYSVGWPSGGGNPTHFFMFDPLVDTAAGDLEPYVMYANTVIAIGSNDWSNENGSFPPKTWMNKGGVNQIFGSVSPLYYVNYVTGAANNEIGQTGSNAITGKDDLLPLFWNRYHTQTSPIGYKGRSSLLRIDMNAATTGNTLSVATPTSLEYVLISQFALLWDGLTTPLV